MNIKYINNDKNLETETFLNMVKQIWNGIYEVEKTREALSKTINITAWDNDKLVGCVRILTDGYYFGTITEILVLPDYQRKGIGKELMKRVKETSPSRLFFGAQKEAEEFYNKIGCKKSLQSYEINVNKNI